MKRRKWIFDFGEYKKAIIMDAISNITMVGAILFLNELRYSDHYIYFILVIMCIKGVNSYRAIDTARENEKVKKKKKEMEDYKERIAQSLKNDEQ